MKAEHESKIIELAESFCTSLKTTAMRLGNSGGIDETSYNPDTYEFSLVLITAAIYQIKDCFAPFDKSGKRDVKNLQHF